MIPALVPFRAGGKTRLPDLVRADVALAMLGDVLDVALAVGPVSVVTGDPAATALAVERGAFAVDDPGGGQGEAIATGLAALAGPCLVVNADCPAVRARELEALARVAQAGRFGLVEARDGTTNALALPSPSSFAPLFGPGSAARFSAHAVALGLRSERLRLAGLEQDVDTLADLERLLPVVGPMTRAVSQGVVA